MKRALLEGFVVLGFMGLIVLGALSTGVRTSSHGTANTSLLGDFNTLSAALRMHRVNVGRFPETDEGFLVLVERPASLSEDEPWVQIMTRIPNDPWQNKYRYAEQMEKSVAHPFEIRSAGPDGIFNTEDDISSLED